MRYKKGVNTEAGEYVTTHAKDLIKSSSDTKVHSKAPEIRTEATTVLDITAPFNISSTYVLAFNYATALVDIKVAKLNMSGVNIALDVLAFGGAVWRNETSSLYTYW
ncbi:hypothetical protein D3C87_1237210 [compost metagenome]